MDYTARCKVGNLLVFEGTGVECLGAWLRSNDATILQRTLTKEKVDLVKIAKRY
jgi:hypothetical protein